MNENIEAIDKEEEQSLPVYEAQIIDAKEETPYGKPAYTLGKAVGSIIAFSGFLNRLSRVFRSSQRDDQGCPDRRMGRGMGKGRGKRKWRPRRGQGG